MERSCLRLRVIGIVRRLLQLELEQICVDKSLIECRNSIHLHQEAFEGGRESDGDSELSTRASVCARSGLPGQMGQSVGASAAASPFLISGLRPSRLTFLEEMGHLQRELRKLH